MKTFPAVQAGFCGVGGKGPFKITLIKTRFLRHLLFPSLLCLDAPLAVAGWAFVFAASREVSPGLPRPPEVVALFAAVWLIYLGDRLHDARRADRGAGDADVAAVPPRHAWARGHRRVLRFLFGVAGLMGIAMLPFLSSATWTAAAVVAAATTAYFLVFRGKRRDGIPRRLFLPSKEIAISLCFTAGAAIAAAPGSPEMIPLSGLGALAFLVLGNCLLISRQEAAHDAREDPAAYFSGGKANPFLPEVAILLAFGLASISWWCWGGNPAVVALTVIAGLTFVLARSRHPGLDRCIQPVADGLHLLTWAVVFMA